MGGSVPGIIQIKGLLGEWRSEDLINNEKMIRKSIKSSTIQ